MSILKIIAGGFAGVMLFGTAPVLAQEFTASKVTCLEYTNGLGSGSAGRVQSMLARIWMHGYLTGYYKKQGTLRQDSEPRTGERLDNTLLQTCREFAQDSILTVAHQALASTPRELPTQASGDFTPAGYTCEEHVAARTGAAAAANRADIAELWGFAFIQGSKNVAQPDLEVPVESKAQIMAAVNRTCGNAQRAKSPFIDILTAVSEAIKLE